jgi:hypothetical protein
MRMIKQRPGLATRGRAVVGPMGSDGAYWRVLLMHGRLVGRASRFGIHATFPAILVCSREGSLRSNQADDFAVAASRVGQ